MSEYDKTMAWIREHDPSGNTREAPPCGSVTLTPEQVDALLLYIEAYTPGNLCNDDEWDNMEWLYTIMEIWRKLDAAHKESRAR